MKKLLLSTCTVFLFTLVFSQNIMNRIPANSELVIEVGMDKLNKIYASKKVFKLPVWLELAQEMNLKSMTEAGIDFTKPAYFSMDISDSVTYFSFHFHLLNESKFVDLLKRSERLEIQENYQNSGFTLYQNGVKDNLFIKNKIASFSFADLNRDYRNKKKFYLMEKYFDQIKEHMEQEYKQFNIIEGILGRERMFDILNSRTKSFSKSDCYEILDEKGEINIWMNHFYAELGNVISDRDFKQFSKVFSAFDSYQGFGIAMEKSVMEFQVRSSAHTNGTSSLSDLTKGRSLNQDLLKYIPEDRVGLYMFSLNPKAYYDWLKSSLISSMDIQKYVQEESVQNLIDLIEILIDEEAISNLISGDVLCAFNGIESKEISYKTYDYDADFNRIEKLEKTVKDYPEFTIILGVQNHDFFQKIMSILKRENLLVEENDYLLIPANSELPIGMALKLEQDKLILTNDFEMLNKSANGEFYKPVKLKEDLTFYGDFKIQELVKGMASETNDYTDHVLYSLIGSTFKEIRMESVKLDHGIGMKGELHFENKKQNAYISLMKLFNEVYLKMERDRKQEKYQFYSMRIKQMIQIYEDLPADKKTNSGDELVKNAKLALKDPAYKEKSYELRSIIWDLEDAIQGREKEN